MSLAGATVLSAFFLAGQCAHAGQTVITGEFIGCGLGQGLLECRIMGDDGKDYYLSCDVGGSPFPGNMTKAQCEGFNEETLAGKTVSVMASLSPDGDVESVASLKVASKQPPPSKRRLRRGLTLTGIVKNDANGPVIKTPQGTYELDPGAGLGFGDLANIGERHAGRPVTLEGDLLRDWDGDVFIVNRVKE